VQGTRFGMALVDGVHYLTAAHGTAVLSSPLAVRSITVENSLQATGAGADAGSQVPPVNWLLNYFHSVCERFPLDDAISVLEAKASRGQSARVVALRICCGARASLTALSCDCTACALLS
jgi:hypothetical protein